MTIHFGTDGWRGVISDTFTFNNVRQVSQAIADAVASDAWLNGHNHVGADPKRMVVGFDTRFLSDRYAIEVARVLAANGYKVFLTTRRATTASSSRPPTADRRCPSSAAALRCITATTSRAPEAPT